MNKLELIQKAYLESVKGIKEDWLLDSSTKWYDYIVSLPSNLKITYLIVIMDNQVFNGGFHQYFVNGYGQFAQETIKALLDIGSVKKSILLDTAYKLVNKDDKSEEIFRKILLDKNIKSLFVTDELYEPLDELDTKYYDIEDEKIEQMLGSYLESIH